MTGRKIKPEIDEISVKDLNDLISKAQNDLKRDIEPLKVRQNINQDKFHTDSQSSDSTKEPSGLSKNQGRLLYLISLYSKPAVNKDDEDTWIREQPLMVLIYESIILEALDYDYAPAFRYIGEVKEVFNLSQEGTVDLEKLKKDDLINILSINTKDFKTTRCYQINNVGVEKLLLIAQEDKEAINDCVFVPGTNKLLEVQYDFNTMKLVETGSELEKAKNLYFRESSVLDTEEVSYVGSAYIPQCLRGNGRPTFSNAHRVHESSQGEVQVRDNLEEIITLSSVSLFVCEYVPIGPNNMQLINRNLFSSSKGGSCFLTKETDDNPLGTSLKLSTGLTKIDVLDYETYGFANLEADIHFPVENGVVQVETFGVSLRQTGSIFCGMQIESIAEKVKDELSLDNISRLLVDVVKDSSEVLESIFSSNQREMLLLVYQSAIKSRDKISVIVANEISPQLTAEEYEDHGEYETEIKQIIGDIQGCYDISEFDILFFGSDGLLLVGPNCRRHEKLLVAFLEISSLDNFLQIMFGRLFSLLMELKAIRRNLYKVDIDPEQAGRIREDISKSSEKIATLKEIIQYTEDSGNLLHVPSRPKDDSGTNLFNHLKLEEKRFLLNQKIKDITKTVGVAEKHLNILIQSTSVHSNHKFIEQNMLTERTIIKSQEKNIKILKDIQIGLQMLVTLAVFFLAFAILDRFTGTWTVLDTIWFFDLGEFLIKSTPLLWFGISIITASGFLYLSVKYEKRNSVLLQKEQSITHILKKRIDGKSLRSYIDSKRKYVINESYHSNSLSTLCTFTWFDTLDTKGTKERNLQISLTFDLVNDILHDFSILKQGGKPTKLSMIEYKRRLLLELETADIFFETFNSDTSHGSSEAQETARKN